MRKFLLGIIALTLTFTSCSDDDKVVITEAGTLSGGPFTFFVDGKVDNVSGITLTGNIQGANTTYVITDDTGNILGLPPTLEAVEGINFDGAGVGVCLIWHLAYEDGLEGAEVGQNANNLKGNFDLSNSITVNRNNGPVAGMLNGGLFNFCIDGTADNVSGVSVSGSPVGSNSSYIVTDDMGNILGLPPTLMALEGVDFDGAGVGKCLIWYIRYEDGLVGLETGKNANDLEGVFSLSNSIDVIRSKTEAGTLNGGPFNFTVDGTADNVSGITLTGTPLGSNSSFIITDDTGSILGLPPTMAALEGVDFDGAGVGVCLIWYIRYEDGIVGLETGKNANDLQGCFNLSNSITVNRN